MTAEAGLPPGGMTGIAFKTIGMGEPVLVHAHRLVHGIVDPALENGVDLWDVELLVAVGQAQAHAPVCVTPQAPEPGAGRVDEVALGCCGDGSPYRAVAIFTTDSDLIAFRAVDVSISVNIGADMAVDAGHAGGRMEIRRSFVVVIRVVLVGEIIVDAMGVHFPAEGYPVGRSLVFGEASFANALVGQADSPSLEMAAGALLGGDLAGQGVAARMGREILGDDRVRRGRDAIV